MRGNGRSRNRGKNDATVANTDDLQPYIIIMLSVHMHGHRKKMQEEEEAKERSRNQPLIVRVRMLCIH